ncbi:MAG: ceV [Bacteriovoracaceae bacterium]|nr:ceV [Bacteriovoracaceae bacterium]
MLTLNLFDELFRHCITSANIAPIRLKWIRDQKVWPGTTIFTDSFVNSPLVSQVKCKNKIFWLLESKEITSEAYDLTEKFHHAFDTVLTHDRALMESNPKKFRFTIPVSYRELQQDGIPTMIYPKTKHISTIASDKNKTTGHRFRHEVIRHFCSSFDVFGRGYRPIKSVSEGLKDYRFSVTIENSSYDYYFTEKILNCFDLGTIPIYWGCPSIGNFFDLDGIIRFEHLGELASILSNLKESDYEKRLPAVKRNFELVQKYLSAEEWMFDHIRDLFHE